MEEKIKISIIIVNYNTKRELESCINSISESRIPCKFEVIVVDNASSDSSLDIIKEKFSWVNLLENDVNEGFARANNKAILLSKGEFVLLLNPDIILSSNSIENMINFMEENPRAGILGSRLVNDAGKLMPSCEKFPSVKGELLQNIYLDKLIPSHKFLKKYTLSKWRHDEIRAVDWVTGACFLIRRCLFDEIGLLDENYFLYYEDVDFCYRASRVGWKTYFLPTASAIHNQGRSTKPLLGKTVSMSYWSRFFFYKKHYARHIYKFLRLIINLGLILRIFTRTLFLPFSFSRYRDYCIYMRAYISALSIRLSSEKKLSPMRGDWDMQRIFTASFIPLVLACISIIVSRKFFSNNQLLEILVPALVGLLVLNVFKSEIFVFSQKVLLYIIFGLLSFYGVVEHNIYKIFKGKLKTRKILVAQMGHIGDLILTVPFLRKLTQVYPGCSITMLVGDWNREMTKVIPYVNNWIFYNNPFLNKQQTETFFQMLANAYNAIKKVRREAFDIAFDLRGHINSLWIVYMARARCTLGFNYQNHGLFLDEKQAYQDNVYEADRLLDLFKLLNIKVQDTDKELEFSIPEADEKKAESILKNQGVRNGDFLIGIFPGAPWHSKRWPEENFMRLCNFLANKYGCKVLVFGGPRELKLGKLFEKNVLNNKQVLNLAGKTTLLQLAALIKKCRIFISNDTGPMHVSMALKVPTIALFGPTSFLRWFPVNSSHILLKSDVPCTPCKLINHSFIPERCINPEVKCMHLIEVEEALKKVDNKLSGKVPVCA